MMKGSLGAGEKNSWLFFRGIRDTLRAIQKKPAGEETRSNLPRSDKWTKQ